MSVAGAIGTGLMVSGIVIKFQKSIYDSKINELNGYATELDSRLATLEAYKSEIPGFWGDNTGEKYVQMIDKQIQQIRVTRQSIQDLSTLYDNLKQALDNAQNTVSDKVDELTGIVGALTGLTE